MHADFLRMREMELPRPPDDPEMTKIIDKLANFVARNGPEFEQMTKQKQRDNPKFSFLFGGENFNYYQYKVTTEQAILKKQQMLEEQQQLLVQQQHALVQQEKEKAAAALQQQISTMQQQTEILQTQMSEQISQSENNLAAQYQSMMRQQQVQIEELILTKRQERLKELAEGCEVDLSHFDDAVQPIIDSCTKDAILNGKTWIMARALSEEHCELISHYFLDRLTSKQASFSLRLHLIYLLYDIIHHCVRRSVGGLKESLERVVVPIFCTARLGADDGPQTEKLDKLLKLWENHGYLIKETLEKLHDPAQSLSAYQAALITDNAEIVTQVNSQIQSQYSALQKQHQDFANHLNLQLSAMQQQLAILMAQQQAANAQAGPPDPQVRASTGRCPLAYDPYVPPPGLPPPGMPALQAPPQQFEYSHGMGAPTAMPPNQFALPDLSKPPPGFPPTGPTPLPGALPTAAGAPPALPTDMDLTPTLPYYELPAGLMAPLVKWEHCDYRPLDPKDIRLPAPMAPSERLLAAVDAFYTAPSRERPRDSEGWEKLGLYEFFKAKQQAKSGRRRYSRSTSRSRSRSRSRSMSRSRSRSRSETPPRRRKFDAETDNHSRSRSRSATPPRRRRFDSENDDRRSSRNRSRSRSQSNSPVQKRMRSRSRSRSSSRSRSRSPEDRRRSRSESPERTRDRRVSRERSPTPPSFTPGLGMGPVLPPLDTRLGEANKGHQLLMKMGWSGKGLGASEQGIVDPIEAADVRDKVDMRKGMGIDLRDPYEQFRKNKAQGFIQRMRARDDTTDPEPPPVAERKKTKKKDRD